MPILPEEAHKIRIPQMHDVRQLFPDDKLEDIEKTVWEKITSSEIKAKVKPGSRAAVLVGSRGIASLKEIVKATVDALKAIGAVPFIVPSMGSHGGGIAEEQRKIIEKYGVTEEYTGVKIISSMQTNIIAKTIGGIPVHIDKVADEADIIIPVARIKAHTDFEGPIESGFCKMIVIGLGNHSGCSRLHQEGASSFDKLIPEVADIVLQKKNIPFGVGIIENAFEHVHSIHVVPGEKFISEEPGLLVLSKSLMPKLQFDEIDVLVIELIGKNISGAGIDPNVTGRSVLRKMENFKGPTVKRIVALDLSAASHGNATGIGVPDFILQQLFEKMNPEVTYANCIAAGAPEAAKVPPMLENEEDAIRAAIQTAHRTDTNAPKIVKIRSSLHLIDIKVSDALLDYCRQRPDKFQVVG